MPSEKEISEEEQVRRDEVVKRMLATPPQPREKPDKGAKKPKGA